MRPEFVYKYIEALRDTGIKYAELDYRTLLAAPELPKDMGYIFRLTSPGFIRLTDVFDFSYISMTANALSRKIKTDVPVMVELPFTTHIPDECFQRINENLVGTVGSYRMKGSLPLMTKEQVSSLSMGFKRFVNAPVDICSLNGFKTAVDTAVKFTFANIDSITLCIGAKDDYASFEDYLFTLMTVYQALPKELDLASLCRAVIYHKLIFGNIHDEDSLTRIMNVLNTDISFLTNVDSGEHVSPHVSVRNNRRLQKTFESVLEKMADKEEIPEDFMEEITDALRKFDTNFYNDEILGGYTKGLLN
jgi:hypothetical protein